MKSLFFSSAVAVMLSAPIVANGATSGYLVSAEGNQSVTLGVSPNGSKVFGLKGSSGADAFSSWVFDTASRTTTQATTYSDENMDAGGQIYHINDGGVAVGCLRDDAWRVPDATDSSTGELRTDYPLTTACFWKDGVLTKLDHNRWEDPAKFVAQDGTVPATNNGFVACHISADGKIINGYLKAFTYMLPVRWTLGSDGTYTSTMLSRKTGEFFYTWVGASADGKRVVMNDKNLGGKSYIWDGDAEPQVFVLNAPGSLISESSITALSPSGRYALVTCTRNSSPAYCVYDFETGSVDWIARPEGTVVQNWFAANVVSDRRDGFIVDYNYRLYYYSIDLGITIPFTEYIGAYGVTELPETLDMARAIVAATSDNGLVIGGNTLSSALPYQGFIVRLPDVEPMLFGLNNVEAYYCGPSRVAVKFDSPKLPTCTTFSHYNVVVDGQPVADANIKAGTAADGRDKVEFDLAAGDHTIVFGVVVKTADNKEAESVKQTLTVGVSPDTSLYFFEDLDDSDVDEETLSYIYIGDTFRSLTPDEGNTLSFRLDYADFCNTTPFWYTCGYATTRWDTYLESRWFDATAEKNFYMTWHERSRFINDADEYAESNRFLLEYSLDGEEWTPLHESTSAENNGVWMAREVSLAALAGKVFKLRFHATGTGEQPVEWRLDFYGILSDDAVMAPIEGLMVTRDEPTRVELAWKNGLGEYEVSYNYNSPMTYNHNLGNEGRSLYVACDYGRDKLAPFVGKYITAVATMVYEPEDVEQAGHTTVEAIIFDMDGNELSRGCLADDAPWYDIEVDKMMPNQRIVLDKPVKIEAGKTYRVATCVSGCVEEMCPIWYFSASDDYISGVTDLYSDDDLQSWHTIADLYADADEDLFRTYGRCIFNIRPCITDEPDAITGNYDQKQWFYQVYRDGVAAPHGLAYYTQQVVKEPNVGSATYTIQSFTRDGRHTAMSEPLRFVSAGLESVVDEQAISLTISDEHIIVNGDYDNATLYTIGGVAVGHGRAFATAGLAKGVYIVVIEKDKVKSSQKVIL